MVGQPHRVRGELAQDVQPWPRGRQHARALRPDAERSRNSELSLPRALCQDQHQRVRRELQGPLGLEHRPICQRDDQQERETGAGTRRQLW